VYNENVVVNQLYQWLDK